MSGLNQCNLIGNLGNTPEVRYTQSGTAVCNLRLAVNERKKKGDEWVDHCEWIDVVCWDKTAENVGQHLDKGSQIHVTGRLQTREYKDKEGNDRKATEVVADRVLFLGGKSGAKSSSPPRTEKPMDQAAPPPSSDAPPDDLPF